MFFHDESSIMGGGGVTKVQQRQIFVNAILLQLPLVLLQETKLSTLFCDVGCLPYFYFKQGSLLPSQVCPCHSSVMLVIQLAIIGIVNFGDFMSKKNKNRYIPTYTYIQSFRQGQYFSLKKFSKLSVVQQSKQSDVEQQKNDQTINQN